MSYNVDNSEYLCGKLYLDRAKVDAFIEEHGTLPESNFIEDASAIGPDGEIVHLWWTGAWSGYSVENGDFVAALALTTGEADILLTWEGGDSVTGYRVKDGVAIEYTVETRLGEPVRSEENGGPDPA